MQLTTYEATLRASADRAFEVLADVERLPRWLETAQRARWADPDRRGLGASFRLHFGGEEAEGAIDRHEPGRAVGHTLGRVALEATLRPVTAEQTDLTLTLRGIGPAGTWVGRLVARLFGGFVERATRLMLVASVERLARLCETEGHGG